MYLTTFSALCSILLASARAAPVHTNNDQAASGRIDLDRLDTKYGDFRNCSVKQAARLRSAIDDAYKLATLGSSAAKRSTVPNSVNEFNALSVTASLSQEAFDTIFRKWLGTDAHSKLLNHDDANQTTPGIFSGVKEILSNPTMAPQYYCNPGQAICDRTYKSRTGVDGFLKPGQQSPAIDLCPEFWMRLSRNHTLQSENRSSEPQLSPAAVSVLHPLLEHTLALHRETLDLALGPRLCDFGAYDYDATIEPFASGDVSTIAREVARICSFDAIHSAENWNQLALELALASLAEQLPPSSIETLAARETIRPAMEPENSDCLLIPGCELPSWKIAGGPS